MTTQQAPEVGPGRPQHIGRPLFHPDLRDNHRFLAGRLELLAEFVQADADAPRTSGDDRVYLEGYHGALLDLAHHLRAGDYLPGGMLNYPESTAC